MTFYAFVLFVHLAAVQTIGSELHQICALLQCRTGVALLATHIHFPLL